MVNLLVLSGQMVHPICHSEHAMHPCIFDEDNENAVLLLLLNGHGIHPGFVELGVCI